MFLVDESNSNSGAFQFINGTEGEGFSKGYVIIHLFGTIVKLNFPVRLAEDRLTPSFHVTETILQRSRVQLKKTQDWKCHTLSWTK
jgi:hypothetical protein